MTPRFRPALTPLEARDNPASAFVASGAVAGGAPLVEVVAPGGFVLTQFQAFESSFTGGVRADTGELDGDPATIEVAVGAGPGGGPRVQIYAVNKNTGVTLQLGDFFAYEDTYRDGIRIAVGDIDGVAGGLAQVVVGTDPNGGPRVRAFRFDTRLPVPLETPLGNFFALEPEFRGGVRVAAGELDGNTANGDELAVAAGPGGGPRVRVLRGDGTVVRDFFVTAPAGFLGGVNLSYNPTTGSLLADLSGDDFSQRSDRLNAPIRAALAARSAALAAGNVNGLGTGFGNGTLTGTATGNTLGLGTSDTGGFSIGQNGGTNGNNGNGALTGAFGTTTSSNLGAFGTTTTSNPGAFGTGAAGTGVNGGTGTGTGTGTGGNGLFF